MKFTTNSLLILLSMTSITTNTVSASLRGHAGERNSNKQIPRTLDLDEQDDQPKDDLPEPPSNDKCATAQDLGLLKAGSSLEVTGSTEFATAAELSENLACNILDTDFSASQPSELDAASTPSVWYTFQVEEALQVTISLCGSSYDTQLAIFPGHVCAAEESSTVYECSGFDDDTDNCPAAGHSTLGSRIAGHPVSPGVTYLVLITGYKGAKGDFVMDLHAS